MKIRNIQILFVAVLLNLGLLFSQDDRLDEYSFEQEPIQTESAAYFGVGGGYTFTFHFANFDKVNEHLLSNNFNVGQFDGQLMMHGGEGFTGVLFIKNLNVSFFSYGGSLTKSVDTLINSVNFKRAVDYSAGFTGINLDYGVVLFKSFAIKPGIGFGWGSISLESYQTNSEIDWTNYKPENLSSNFLNRVESSYLFAKPNLSLEYALTNYLLIRANAAYPVTFSYDWKFNKNAKVTNIPDDFNSNGMQFQLGIFVGLFNF